MRFQTGKNARYRHRLTDQQGRVRQGHLCGSTRSTHDRIFHSVATKHLPHYLGWHRELSASKELSLERLCKTITDHWEHQPLMET